MSIIVPEAIFRGRCSAVTICDLFLFQPAWRRGDVDEERDVSVATLQ